MCANSSGKYSAPELAELIRAANAILKTQESTLLRVVAQQPTKVANGVKIAQKSRSANKT